MPLLIAVGGTGQHVALAASRLSYLGALPPMEATIIDADDASTLTRRLVSFGDTLTPEDDHPFRIREMFSPLNPHHPQNARFEDLFALDDHPEQRELFEAFFDEPSAAVKVDFGMYGNPAVGATIFPDAPRDAMANLNEAARKADAVHVAGSFAGGTGAGVMHQLLRQLHTLGCEERTFLLALLPWHQPAGPVGSDAPLSPSSQNRNMRFGVQFLHHQSRHLALQTCLLGIPSAREARVRPAMVEVGNNREYPHLLHAVACYFMHHVAEATVTLDRRHAVSTFLHDPDQPRWLLEQTWHADTTLQTRLLQAQGLLAVLRFLATERVRSQFAASYGLLFGPRRDTYSESLWRAVKDHTPRGQKPTALATEVWSCWEMEVRRLEFVLNWAQEVFGKLPDSAPLGTLRQNPTEVTRSAAPEHLAIDASGKQQDARSVAHWFTARLKARIADHLAG